LLESSSKASKNFKKPQISEILQIQAPKSFEELLPQTFKDEEHVKNTLRTQRTHEKRKEQRISKELIARDSL